MLCHAIHLGLQLVSRNRALPVIFQCLRLAQVIFDFLFQLRLRHYCVERRLGIGPLLWPYTVAPVHVFDSSLI